MKRQQDVFLFSGVKPLSRQWSLSQFSVFATNGSGNRAAFPDTLGYMAEEKIILETALLCAPEALSMQDMKNLLENTETEINEHWKSRIGRILAELSDDWSGKGLELVQVANGWRFQSRPEMKPWLARLTREKLPKYGRATLETLAIIAYNQPVTRGDIEQIRGVMVNPNAIRMLEERGWIEVIGHRETLGRPALFATTRQFLADLGLASLEELPPLLQSVQGKEEGSELLENGNDLAELLPEQPDGQ